MGRQHRAIALALAVCCGAAAACTTSSGDSARRAPTTVSTPSSTIASPTPSNPTPSTTATTAAPSGEGVPASNWTAGDGSERGLALPTTEADRAAVRLLWQSIPVAEPIGASPYDRDQFGQRWSDDNSSGLFDHNGCDTRNDVLARDLRDTEARPGTRGCVIISGSLDDPYIARVLSFAKADAQAVQIDHVYSLSRSWDHGASTWSDDKRLAFANDPLNLLAVDGPTNASKSDLGPEAWLPPAEGSRCGYVARVGAVAARYGLTVSAADAAAALDACS